MPRWPSCAWLPGGHALSLSNYSVFCKNRTATPHGVRAHGLAEHTSSPLQPPWPWYTRRFKQKTCTQRLVKVLEEPLGVLGQALEKA